MTSQMMSAAAAVFLPNNYNCFIGLMNTTVLTYHHYIQKKNKTIERLLWVFQCCTCEVMEQKEIFVPFLHMIMT